MSKARRAAEAIRLEDIPNIGKSLAVDLRSIGVHTPSDVKAMSALSAYESLRTSMGKRHDPCVLDVFMAAHDFMNGGPAQPWWHFTAQRRQLLANTHTP